jgi:hypothetical protein
MPIEHEELTHWIAIKKSPCFRGLFEVKDADETIARARIGRRL